MSGARCAVRRGALAGVCVSALFFAGTEVGRARGLDGAFGLSLLLPVGSELRAVYPWGIGAVFELRFVHSAHLSASLSGSPAVAWGTPRSGSLAAGASARLLHLPAHLEFVYTFGQGRLRPYGGAGAGILHVQEKLSFSGPLGESEESVSATRLSFCLKAGVEKEGATRPFAELHYQHAGTSGIEGQPGSGVSLSALQFRLGVRTRLK